MRKTKKILSWLLALSMVLGMLPAAAFAAEEPLKEPDIIAEETVVPENGEPMDDEVQPQNRAGEPRAAVGGTISTDQTWDSNTTFSNAPITVSGTVTINISGTVNFDAVSGGMVVQDGASLTLKGSDASSCKIKQQPTDGTSGVLKTTGTGSRSITIEGVTIDCSTSNGVAAGAPVAISTPTTLVCTSSNFVGRTAINVFGNTGSTTTLKDCHFTASGQAPNAGISITSGTLAIENCTLVSSSTYGLQLVKPGYGSSPASASSPVTIKGPQNSITTGVSAVGSAPSLAADAVLNKDGITTWNVMTAAGNVAAPDGSVALTAATAEEARAIAGKMVAGEVMGANHYYYSVGTDVLVGTKTTGLVFGMTPAVKDGPIEVGAAVIPSYADGSATVGTPVYVWQRAASANGPWMPMDGVATTTASYTLTAADIGKYIRVVFNGVEPTASTSTSMGSLAAALGPVTAAKKTATITLGANVTRDTTEGNGALVQEVSAGVAITPIAITAAAEYKMPYTVKTDIGNGLSFEPHATDVTKGTITGIPAATGTSTMLAAIQNGNSVNISGTNCTVTGGTQTPTVGSAITAIAVKAAAGYVLPATIASNLIGGLTYTRDTSDDTKATIAGTPTGAVTATITATARTDFYVKADATAAEATGTKEKPFATIQAAYDAVPVNGTATIKLLSNITATAVTNFNAEKTVTIKSDSAVQTVKRDTTLNTAAVFNATNGTVTFEDIILDGNAGWDEPTDLKNRAATATSTAQYMTISDTAAVILGSGSVVQNHARSTTNSTTGMTGGDHGGAIGLDGGSLTMKTGAKIQNNDVTGSIADGGAVSVWNGTFTMEGGTLTGNTASRFGGAVRSATGAIVLMNGGEISGNAVTEKNTTASPAGGGVLISQGDFTVGKTVTITGNKNLSGTTAMADDVSFSNYYSAPIIEIDGLTSSKIGVRTTEAVVAGTDYKFAVNATNAADDVKHFFANNDTDVGVVFCDGTNDWINGKNVGALTSHTHAPNTLWLSVEARIMIVPGVTTGGEGFITLDPEPGTDYGFLAPNVQKPIIITNVKGEVVGTQDPDTGWITFPEEGGPFTVRPLPKGEEVTVVTKPTGETTDPGKGEVLVIVTIPEVGENIYVEITDPDKKATIVIEPSDEKLTYIVTDPDGTVIVTGPGNGGKLELKPLDPGKDYIITTMPNPADPTKPVPGVGTEIHPDTDPYSPGVTVKTPPVTPAEPTLPTKDITRYPGEDETDSITVNPTVSGQYYWLVDKTTGQIVAPATGSGAGFVSPDADGIIIAGDGNGLTFTGLDKNKTYEVRTSSGDPKGTPAVLPIKPVVVDPITVDPGSLTGKVIPADPDKGKTEITINPADPNKVYAVVDPETGATVTVTGGNPWVSPDGGKVTLKPLDPGKEYIIVTKDKNDDTTDPGDETGIKITTPVDPTTTLPGTSVDLTSPGPVRDRITDPDENAGKDRISVTNPGTGFEIAIIDPATGKVVAPIKTGTGTDDTDGWQPGTGTAGQGTDLTFAPLDPNKRYEVVVRPTTPEDSIRVPATPGVSVPKIGDMSVTGKVVDADGNGVPGATVKVTVETLDGGYQTITAITKPDGTYKLEGANIKLDQTYAVYVDGKDKGCKTESFQFTKAPIENKVITTNPAVANIMGGALAGVDGKPVKNETVVIRDKVTGAALNPQPGRVLTTTAGGGYVIENLPEGTYIIEVAAGGKSGMTEVKVDANGKITPNKDGGYKTTDITFTTGSIVSGKVEGLAAGETATVTVTVPITDKDGKVIGTKNMTSTAIGKGEGEDGYWQIAGVPDGTYVATVTTPDGKTDQVTLNIPTKLTGNNLTPAKGAEDKASSIVTGIVMDKDGKPVPGADVTIYDKDGAKVSPTNPATITTGKGGGWAVEGLDPAKGPYIASVDKDGVNGKAGPFNVGTDGKVTGTTNVELTGSMNDTGTTFTPDTTGKLLSGVVKDDSNPAKPVSDATVVVKDASGNVIATTKTNANGAYFVPNMPDGATVNVTTGTGASGSNSLTTEGGKLTGNVTVTKPGDTDLVVIGPKGEVLLVGTETATNAQAKVTITKGSDDATGSFTITGGKVSIKSQPVTPDGTYTIKVEQNGMLVEKTITVTGGKITDGNPISIGSKTISGTVDYKVGDKNYPSNATVEIKAPAPGNYSWGTGKVNPNTGKYEIAGIPDGTYQTVITVTDPGNGTKTDVITGTVTVVNGVPTYTFPDAGTNGAGVTAAGGALTVTPGTDVKRVNGKIDIAIAPEGTLEQVKDAIDDLKTLTAEQGKQVDKEKVAKLTDKLNSLLTALSMSATANNVGSAAQSELAKQSGLLVADSEITTATEVDKKVDVKLSMTATDVTEAPPAADRNKAEVAARGAEVGAFFDVSIQKTTTVTEVKTGEEPVELSKETAPVTEVPQPITITLNIPEELQTYAYFNVIRVHNGVAERIPSTATKATVTFQSSLYSTYAIAASNDKLFEDDVPTTEPTPGPSTGTGGGGTTTGVTVPKNPGGTVTVSPTDPGKGEEFIITVIPDEGYVLDKLTVKDPKGNELTITPMGGGKYKVTMPDPAVKLTVDATFKKLNSAPHANGVADLLNADDHIAYMKGRDGGMFAPAENMTRAEVAQMFYNLLKTRDTDLGSKASYSDVSADAWYAKAVNTLANIGVVNGTGDGKFSPDRTITRAEFIAIAARFADVATGGDTFSDVPATHWAYDEITTATAYGWISGYGDGTFKPGANIARSEAVKIVNAMLARSADKSFVDAAKDLVTFPDVPKTDWAYYPIVEATNAHDFELKNGAETWKSK